MKKKLSLLTVAFLALLGGVMFAADALGSDGATQKITWDFSEFSDPVQLIGENYQKEYEGLLLVGNQSETTDGKDYVDAKSGFHMNGASNTSRRYIKYTPEYNGNMTVTYKSNNNSATDRITAIGTSVENFKKDEVIPVSVIAHGFTDGSTEQTIKANLTAGTVYYIYFAEGGQSITKLEYEYTIDEKEPTGKFSALVASALAGDGTLTLDADYTVDEAVNVPLGKQLTIDGAGHILTLGEATNFVINDNITLKDVKIDATALTQPLIALAAEPAEGTPLNESKYTDATTTGAYLLNAVTVDNVMVKNLTNSFISTNGEAWAVESLTLTNSIIQLDHNTGKTFLDFYTGKDNKTSLKELTLKNNTIYNLQENSNAYFFRLMHNSNCLKVFASKDFKWTMTNNTLVRMFTGKDFANNMPSNAAVTNVTSNNVFYDVYRLYQYIQSNQLSTTEGNVMWNVVTSPQPNDQSRTDKQGNPMTTLDDPGFVAPTTALDLTAENGGIDLTIGASTKAAEYQAGDPRWVVEYVAPATFAITVADADNGTVTVDKEEAAEGETVTITIEAAEGYEIDAIKVVAADETEVTVAEDNTFVMPAQAVTVTVTFKQTTGIENINAADADNGAWYNLNGVRVEKPVKGGIYIHNGNKVVIK